MTLLATNLYQPDDWWWQALGSSTMRWCIVLLIGTALALMLVVRGLYRLAQARAAAKRHLHRNQEGTATIEFALVFPIGLFLFLLLLQVTLLAGGNMFVNYAAFAATRSAIVQIPQDYTAAGAEKRNDVVNADNSPKHELIRQAAVYALVPVSGPGGKGSSAAGMMTPETYVAGLESFYKAYGQDVPKWVTTLAAKRLQYADTNTKITLLEAVIDPAPPHRVTWQELPSGGPFSFGPKDPVTVQVTHKFNLSIPYVRTLFADSDSEGTGGWKHRTMWAQYTLTNEGIRVELPDLPSLPRVEWKPGTTGNGGTRNNPVIP